MVEKRKRSGNYEKIQGEDLTRLQANMGESANDQACLQWWYLLAQPRRTLTPLEALQAVLWFPTDLYFSLTLNQSKYLFTALECAWVETLLPVPLLCGSYAWTYLHPLALSTATSARCLP